jgi:purine-binding chemotaxis protein CheW
VSAAAASAARVAQVVTFALGDDLFALDVRTVERVLRYRGARPVPRLPGWVAGVVEHAGRSLPVVELRRRFELPPAEPAVEPRVLVVEAGEERIGVVVDRVVDVSAVAAGGLDPAPALFRGLSGDYLLGVLRRDGRLIVVLDGGRLLSATERMTLTQALADV